MPDPSGSCPVCGQELAASPSPKFPGRVVLLAHGHPNFYGRDCIGGGATVPAAGPDLPEPLTPAAIFGSNSDGGVRMWEWLEVMCRGCRRETVYRRAQGEGGGAGCEIADRAITDPYEADMPEWSLDATWPERFADPEDGLEPGAPWPVCTAFEPRKRRADAGLRRGPRRPAGQGELFPAGGA